MIDESNEEAYQNLFSIIFSDFYLFDASMTVSSTLRQPPWGR